MYKRQIIDSIPSSETSVFIDEVRKTYLKGYLPAKLYGLPKVHKNGIPMRPVLSTIGSANHKISKVLDKFLQPFTVTKYTCNDVFEFTKEINEQKATTSHYMVSFDVKSLFTMVPIEETINCSRLFAVRSKGCYFI